MEEIFSNISSWLDSGKSAALVTVISRQGSAPREVGAKMAVSSDLQIIGSVSSGCVEGAAAEESMKCMETRDAKIVEYGISDDLAWSVGLTCGGQIKVLIQPVVEEVNKGLNYHLLRQIEEEIRTGSAFKTVTALSADQRGKIFLVSAGKQVFPDKDAVDWVSPEFLEQSVKLTHKSQSGVVQIQNKEYFIDVYSPPARLVVIGAVHIAIPLVDMAKVLGYETIVIDPREVFATKERFPRVDLLIKDWPTSGLEKINLSRDDFILLLSHDDKLDLPALAMAIDRQTGYIGMLSSRKSRDERYKKMIADGYKAGDLEKIHSPVGLNIGGKSPEEIALSILAEITAAKNSKLTN